MSDSILSKEFLAERLLAFQRLCSIEFSKTRIMGTGTEMAAEGHTTIVPSDTRLCLGVRSRKRLLLLHVIGS